MGDRRSGAVYLCERGGRGVYLYFGGNFGMGIDFWLNGVARMDSCSDDYIIFQFYLLHP